MRFPGLLLGLMMVVAPSVRAQAPEKADLLRELRIAGERLVALAEAIPEEKYSWRPAEGVRSVSEVLVHVGSTNYFLLGAAGAPADNDLPANPEKAVVEKARVIALVREGFAKAAAGMEASDPAGWDKPVSFVYSPATVRTVYVRMAAHATEHLGQLIAYARMNGVTPPWSQ